MNTRSSIGLLSVLLLLVACGGEQPAVEETPAEAESEGSDLLGLLPADNAVSGWSKEGEPRFFIPDNLWEFINGAADGYILYGFQEVVTSDYAGASGEQSAVIDIYRMKDPTHAFGIYCQERNPDYEFLDIGAEGYVGGTAMNFWHGPYYVKMTVFEESDELKEELRKLANHISGKIDYPTREPVEVGLFPKENQKPRSVQFLPRDVLGQSYLSNAFEAQYVSGEREYKVVVVMPDDADAAQEGLTKYKEFLSGSGEPIKDLEGMGDEGFVGTDRYYGTVLAARAGNKILVILGPPSEDAGKTALFEMLKKIEQGT